MNIQEVMALYQKPLLKLICEAQNIHQQYHKPFHIQKCQLISIKTGGCSEDCKYCSQSSRYQTPIKAQAMMKKEEAVRIAKQAVQQGVTRICLGAAWREIKENYQFSLILEMVKEIAELGVEVCCTLGMLTGSQAHQLKEAGLFAYNHNLDSSEKFYKTIISTRSYQDRLKTHDTIGKQGISLCSGIILGMGESVEDRIEFLHVLYHKNPHPESIPINRLVPISGTPLGEKTLLSIWELVRMIATTRLIFPRSMIRLSAGRETMTAEEHALAFLAGANSIHMGEKLLTVKNPSYAKDQALFDLLGLS